MHWHPIITNMFSLLEYYACRRLDRDPSQNSMVCSCHFKNSEKSNLPTIFEWNKNKIFTSVSPEPKRKTSTKQTSPKIHAAAASELRNPESGRSVSCASSSLLQNFDKLQIPGNIEQEAEMYFLKKENEELKKKQHCQNAFSYEHIKSNDKLINMYTGIPNSYLFETLYSIFENMHLKYAMGWSVTNIPRVDQLLLTLMKLRLNLLHLDLAHRFNCSSTTVTNVVITWVCALHEILFCQLMKEIPSRHKNRTCMPSAFSAFSNCRIILDCTEVKYVKPKQMYKQKVTYSHYKHQNTLKGLIGVAPNGVITFMSELYPGSTSDKNIVKDSGILEKFHCGDIVADKGFLIKDILPPGVHLNIPPFLTSAQFTPEQIIQTRSIAKHEYMSKELSEG